MTNFPQYRANVSRQSSGTSPPEKCAVSGSTSITSRPLRQNKSTFFPDDVFGLVVIDDRRHEFDSFLRTTSAASKGHVRSNVGPGFTWIANFADVSVIFSIPSIPSSPADA